MISEIREGDIPNLKDGIYIVFLVELSSEGRIITTDIRAISVSNMLIGGDSIMHTLGLNGTSWIITGITRAKD